jgi:hypothetical protein
MASAKEGKTASKAARLVVEGIAEYAAEREFRNQGTTSAIEQTPVV